MTVFLIGTIVLSIWIAIFAYKVRLALIAQVQRLEQECLKLKKELRMIGAGTFGVGQRVNKIEDYIHRISSRQDAAELKQGTLASYAHAAKIVEIGGSVADIVEGCGITYAEAELVAMLHQKSQIEKRCNN